MKIAIYGYGNIGRGVECAITQNDDAELFGVFTRRAPESLKTLTGCAVYPAADIENYAEEIDVVIICAGSATDLPEMTPALAAKFNVVSIPTLIVFKDGQETARLIGYKPKEAILAELLS